jgi:hypothetical protein
MRFCISGLDPPLLLYFPRLVLRTLGRVFGTTSQCAPGCEESVNTVFFSRESIIWWCLSNHWAHRRKTQAAFRKELEGLVSGQAQEAIQAPRGGELRRVGKRQRIGGWGGEYREWWAAVEEMVAERKRR